jgi:hypothetical protein
MNDRTMERQAIIDQLQRLGEAISSGDVDAVADHWEVPAMVLHDGASRLIPQRKDVETFFSEAMAWYRSQGLVSTAPIIERVDRLSEQVAIADVTWQAYDAANVPKSSERSHYVMQAGADGVPRIRIAITLPSGNRP